MRLGEDHDPLCEWNWLKEWIFENVRLEAGRFYNYWECESMYLYDDTNVKRGSAGVRAWRWLCDWIEENVDLGPGGVYSGDELESMYLSSGHSIEVFLLHPKLPFQLR